MVGLKAIVLQTIKMTASQMLKVMVAQDSLQTMFVTRRCTMA